jgi:hypothetical protein
MHRFLLYILVALATTIPSESQNLTGRGMRTNASFNGRFWNTLPPQTKAGYVFAIMDSANIFPSFAPKDCICAIDTSMTFLKELLGDSGNPTPNEIIEEMDAFFKEQVNRQIPILQALRYVSKKMTGSTQNELQQFEITLRKEATRLQ